MAATDGADGRRSKSPAGGRDPTRDGDDYLVAAVEALATVPPWDPGTDPQLGRAVDFLGRDLDAETVLRAADGAGVVAAVAVAVSLTVFLGAPSVAVPAALLVGLAVAAAARYLPRGLATARRTRALGAAPELVSSAVLRMRLAPTPETAAAFAAETSDGRLARCLSAHVRRARGTGRSGLSSFADEWAEWFPALRRALTLVESAGSAQPEERERALDGALDVTLEGTREAMAEFAAGVQGPATALYAFGVLLPLALVALLPTAGTVGLEVPLAAVVVGYDLLLPAALVVASGWLLARRPVAFPPAPVSRSHPDVPDSRWPAAVAGAAVGAGAWLVVARIAAPWAALVTAPAAGLGVGLVVAYRPMTAVRDRVAAVESGLPDALYLVGREVDRGRSVEAALDDAVELLDSATGDVFEDAVRQQRQVRAGVRESFLGEHGALATVPSERARSTAELLAVAASEGRPAGPAVVAMADHLDDLQGVERTIRRDLERVTSTLANTAAVFGPLVVGATVTLAEQMSTDGPLTAAVSPAALGLAVGAYVMALAVILTVLATGLERGLDRSLVGYRVGRALCLASAVFVAGLVGTGWLV
ncbi:type II secretion system F family protein [Halosimplex halophilum]|uniref:type II secretion system F family protein n=1 Tax=Halosimplex halophilum TaxID=2559572 RepID=UPI001AE699D1|nr:type II secretion system protein [Halosimplex halophilum]